MNARTKLLRLAPAGLAVALLLSATAAIAQPAPAQSDAIANGTALSSIRIDNFGRINQNYYRGAQPRAQDYADLAALGVKTVIDLTMDGSREEPDLVRRAGMTFFRIEMTTRETPSAAKVAQFLALVNDPAKQPVYVHCQGGRHRTGVMTAVYRMTTEGWTADQAFAEMKRYRFGADILHPEFKRFVYAYRVDRPSAAPDKVAQATSNAGS